MCGALLPWERCRGTERVPILAGLHRPRAATSGDGGLHTRSTTKIQFVLDHRNRSSIAHRAIGDEENPDNHCDKNNRPISSTKEQNFLLQLRAKFILNRHAPTIQQCMVDCVLHDPLTLASMHGATAELFQ